MPTNDVVDWLKVIFIVAAIAVTCIHSKLRFDQNLIIKKIWDANLAIWLTIINSEKIAQLELYSRECDLAQIKWQN